MTEWIKTYLDAIITQREWSWTLVGMAYLILGLIIRGIFISPLTRRVKDLSKKAHQDVKSAYLHRSFIGWIFFAVSFLIIIGLWNRSDLFPLTVKEALALLGAMASFILSILCHAEAIGVAGLVTLKKVVDKEMGG